MATIVDLFEEIKRVKLLVEDMLTRMVHASQIQAPGGLGDISQTLGLVSAGEFRAGNNLVPGQGFSGVRIGFPSFHYPSTSTQDSDAYHIAGVDVDTLMFGLRASDGVAIFGAGQVELSDSGVAITGGPSAPSAITWYDSEESSDVTAHLIAGRNNQLDTGAFDYALFARVAPNEPTGSIVPRNSHISVTLSGRSTDGTSTGQLSFALNTVTAGSGGLMSLSENSTEILRIWNGSINRSLETNSAELVVNEGANDLDFRVESDSETNALVVDAGSNSIGLLGTPSFGGGTRVIFIGTSAVPSTATPPNGGGVLYVEGNNLKWLDSDANITILST